jgi:hypothetical protein
MTKPQDVVVVLLLALDKERDSPRTYAELGQTLGMSASEVHAAVRRLREAYLLDPDDHVQLTALRNFLIHGVRHAFPARPKEISRGIPTAWAAPAIANKMGASDQLPPVWPDPNGKVQGTAVEPLYPSVPGAARRNPELYELLALVDALRIGRARERSMAEKELSSRLSAHAPA